ncbi:hypothetical protein A9Q81_01830 [Gammaproteobacteria bacterium 42_54_T18]|nr:hypothetical protein A9Q81_01830 [Gammaproteobacteria bacterium 42_54_T18]
MKENALNIEHNTISDTAQCTRSDDAGLEGTHEYTGKKPELYLIPKLASMAHAALNGAVGDTMQDREHVLTAKSGFYFRGNPINNVNVEYIPGSASSRKLIIFLHGVCCNERIWEFSSQSIRPESADTEPTDYGIEIYDSLGYRPFYFRYNSGLSIAENGEKFAEHLDSLVDELAVDVEEIVMVGYSMGGLVMKSALAWASKHDTRFLPLIKKVFYLGSPHYGAPLEKAAKIANAVLERLPFLVTQLVSQIMAFRSQGIKDLGFGDVTPYIGDYWAEHVEHHFVGGTLHSNESHPLSLFLGDLLVRPLSAFPVKDEGHFMERGINYRYRLFPGVNHVQLQRNLGVLRYMEQNLQ